MLPVCLDGQGLASGRVPAFPCGAVLDLELAEPVERNFLALGRSLAYPCEHRIDNLARVSLGDPLFGGDLFGKISVVHGRSEEHTSELQSLMRISSAVFCLKQKTNQISNRL